MSDKTLKVGVIGAGGIARNMHLPSLDGIDGAEVVAVCDLIEERAVEQAERFGIPKTYTIYKKMLAEEKLDAVFVLVEPCNLFHVVVSCLRAGLPTFMEKPPGVTLFQANGLMRAAREAGAPLQVGFNRRHIPLVKHVVKMMREVTAITQVEGRFMKCGAAAFDQGGMSAFPCDSIHAVDLVRWMAGGRPVSAATVVGQSNDVVTNRWNSIVRFDNDVTGVIKTNYQTGGRCHTFEMHGPGASAFINLGFGGADCDARILMTDGKSGYSLAATGPGGYGIQEIDGKQLAGSDEYYRYYGFYQEAEHFVQCVREGKEPETNIEDAVRTFELVEMVLRSVI